MVIATTHLRTGRSRRMGCDGHALTVRRAGWLS